MGKGSIKQAAEAAQSISNENTSPELGKLLDFTPNNSNDWPELKPLIRPLPPAIPFPAEALGLLLSSAALKIQGAVKAPLAICAQSILAAATLAVQHIADVELDGRSMTISNFFLTLGESGERKSAVDSWALRAHRAHELAKKEEYEKAERLFQNEKRLYDEKRRSVTRKRGQTTAELEQELKALGPEPEAPLQPYILVNDPTIEGLMKLFQCGQPSLGLFSDEGGRFIGSYSMSSDHHVQAISTLSNLWDGSPVDRVRGGDGFSKLFGRRLSVHLMAQPRIAGMLLGNQVAQEQGILARFLVSFPESTAGTRQYEGIDLSADPELAKFWTRIRRCLGSHVVLAEGTKNELRPKAITLSTEAKAQWISFHNAIELQLHGRGKYVTIRAFASKAAEHAIRLAAVLTLIEDPDSCKIPAEKLHSATELVDYYLEENLRLSGMGSSSPLDATYEECDRLADWLQMRPREKGNLISIVEIYQTGPRAIRSARKARSLMKTLTIHGYVRRCFNTTDGDKKSKGEMYEIRILDST